LENERLNTYRAHAEASIDEDRGGRFALVRKPATIVGAGPIAYPRLPEDSPWSSNPLPPEPPLGYSVDDLEPVGEVFEQEAKPQVRARWRRL
jgi:hypothetical protein